MDGFDYKQFKKFANDFNIATKDFDRFLKQFLLEMAMRAIAKIKARTPVDTGALRNMWGIGSQELALRKTGEVSRSGGDVVEIDPERSTVESIDVVGSNVEVVIWNEMNYASFVEYGFAMRNGRWHPGTFMMTISIDEINAEMPTRFQSEWKQFLSSKGVS